jgi:hypothetical protein
MSSSETINVLPLAVAIGIGVGVLIALVVTVLGLNPRVMAGAIAGATGGVTAATVVIMRRGRRQGR